MKKIINLVVFAIVLLLISTISPQALTTTLKTSTSKVTPGSEFTISIVASGLTNGLAAAEYTLNYDSSKVSYISSSIGQNKPSGDFSINNSGNQLIIMYADNSGGPNGFNNGTIITLKFKSKASSGSMTFSLNGKEYGDKNGQEITGTTSGATINFYKPSSEALLKSLSVTGFNLNPSFNSSTKNYTLPETDKSEIKISATASTGATISGIGTKKLAYGSNTINIVVTAEDKKTKTTYTIKVNRPDKRSSEKQLKSLVVEGFNIEFNKDTYVYDIELPNDATAINIKAEALDSNAKIEGIGQISIRPDQKSHSIIVTAENGDIAMYSIVFSNRGDSTEVEPNASLKKLVINNLNVNLSEETMYLFGISHDIDQLEIKYETTSPTATVEILNNNGLVPGINKVTIIVKDGTAKQEYIIYVNKDQTSNKVTSISDIDAINTKEDLIVELKDLSNNKLIQSIPNYLKSNESKLYLNYVDGYKGLLYSLIIPPTLDVSGDLTLTLSVTKESPYTFTSTIPAGIQIVYYVGNANLNGLKLYGYNSKTNSQVLIEENVSIENGYLRFTSNGSENYIIASEEGPSNSENILNTNENSKKGSLPSVIYIGIGIVLGVALTYGLQFISKNKDKFLPKKKQPALKSVITPISSSVPNVTSVVPNQPISPAPAQQEPQVQEQELTIVPQQVQMQEQQLTAEQIQQQISQPNTVETETLIIDVNQEPNNQNTQSQ